MLEPLVRGGTGSASEQFEMPEAYPDRLESGTLPGPAIAALKAGCDFIEATGAQKILDHERALADEFRAWCRTNDWIAMPGNSFHMGQTVQDAHPVVSFSVKGLSPDRVADVLDENYGIAVRPGLHCAAQAHRTLGTIGDGLVRASFGYFNTEKDVSLLCSSLTEMHRKARF